MDCDVRCIRIDPSDTELKLPELWGFAPYKAVIVIDEPCSCEFRDRAARWLVDTGCLYAMAWGHECSLWDDAIDDANLADFDFGEVPDDRFVITTWHDGEPLTEVFWFSENCAFHDSIKLTRTLILHVGPEDRSEKLLALYGDVRRHPERFVDD